ncbi:MAG: hypothetical protein E7321_01805 [Clostridiales bacterium]|nr:hypothetical protein [Clostridiales bacterium]
MTNVERLTERLNACKNRRKIFKAMNALAPIIRKHREELMQNTQPVRSSKTNTMTAREEFNKMLNESADPRLTYNVLAALAITEMQRKQRNQY